MTKLIGICGGSCSGKTTLANNLLSLFEERANYLSQDSYYFTVPSTKEHNVYNHNFDSPDSFDLARFESDLQMIKEGKPIVAPVFDFRVHAQASEGRVLPTRDLCFVDGLFLLERESIRSQFDLLIYLDVLESERHRRRVDLYTNKRGWSCERVETQYSRYVYPMHMEHIEPYKQKANLIFTIGGEDDDAISIIKNEVEILLLKEKT